jgi:hypothetical protein
MLPLDIENIIKDYISQIKLYEKYKKVLNELLSIREYEIKKRNDSIISYYNKNKMCVYIIDSDKNLRICKTTFLNKHAYTKIYLMDDNILIDEWKDCMECDNCTSEDCCNCDIF